MTEIHQWKQESMTGGKGWMKVGPLSRWTVVLQLLRLSCEYWVNRFSRLIFSGLYSFWPTYMYGPCNVVSTCLWQPVPISSFLFLSLFLSCSPYNVSLAVSAILCLYLSICAPVSACLCPSLSTCTFAILSLCLPASHRTFLYSWASIGGDTYPERMRVRRGSGEGAKRERRGIFPLFYLPWFLFPHPLFHLIISASIVLSNSFCIHLSLNSDDVAMHASVPTFQFPGHTSFYLSVTENILSLSTISSTSSSSFSSFSPNLSSLFSLPSRPLLSSTLPCSISYPIPLHTNLFYYHPHSSSSCSLWSFTSCTNPPLLFLFVVLHLYPPPLHFPLPNPPSTSFSSCLFFPLTS